MKQLLMAIIILSTSGMVLAGAVETSAFLYTIEEAVYDLSISKDRIQGKVLLSGKILAGEPSAILLFGKEVVITRTDRFKGGTLMSQHDGKCYFLPDGKKDEFQVSLTFLSLPQEDRESRLISFTVPRALKNTLRLDLSSEISLLEQPGIVDADGVYHFAATERLDVRFIDNKDIAAVSQIDMDTFSRVRLQAKRAIISTTLVPVQAVPRSFVLEVQENAQYIASSLKRSWIKQKDETSYEIMIPSEEKGSFTIQFAVEESDDADSYSISLPKIRDNNGRQGDFIVEEPDDGQISLVGKGLMSNIPVGKLSRELMAVAGKSRFYMRSTQCQPVSLGIKRFKSVSTPPIVLDTQTYFMSFEENGNVLSVLVMDLPPETGPRLKLKVIPDTEIWSLTVNGRKRKVYTNDDDTWIIPLEDGEISHVQLALLRKAEKLGLHGSIEAVLPETGLPSKTIRVGIALPERVQLLSLEGPLTPTSGASWKTPSEFIGKPHFFSRTFYKGQGMKVAVSYKEPVNAINK